MDDFLRPEDHFLDVGANTGLHTLLASTRITLGRITCVEPDPRNLERLRRTIELNRISNAEILPVDASDAPGRVALEDGDVFTRIAPGGGGAGAARVVESVRLDTALGSGARIDFCKIDVEGAEWQVLKGMTGLMERDALPVLAFEFNGCLRAYGHSEAAFLSWLNGHGYEVAAYDHDRRSLNFGREFTEEAGNLFAFTASGRKLAAGRLPRIVVRSAPEPALKRR